MAEQDTFRTYYGNNVTTDFPVTFAYERPDEVVVKTNGVITPFTFINPSVIRIASPLAAGSTMTVQRTTNINSPAVTWKNGSGTTGNQLNAMVRQLINAMQEARDTALRGLFRLPTGEYDFANSRGSNVADPVNDTDAVNKRWVESAPTSNITAAATARTGAEAARDKANLWANAPVNTQVETGQYSAKHWAQTAQAVSNVTAQGIPVTPAGNISSNTVQGALQELDTEKLAVSATSTFGRSLIDDADAAAARTTLGLTWKPLPLSSTDVGIAQLFLSIPATARIIRLAGMAQVGTNDDELVFQFSSDGGVNFLGQEGSLAYGNGYLYANTLSVQNPSQDYIAQNYGRFYTVSRADVPSIFELTIVRGFPSTRWQSHSSGFQSSLGRDVMVMHAGHSAGNTFNMLRMFTLGGSNINLCRISGEYI